MILSFGRHKNPELGAVTGWCFLLDTFTGPWLLFIKRVRGKGRQAITHGCDVATLLLSCEPVRLLLDSAALAAVVLSIWVRFALGKNGVGRVLCAQATALEDWGFALVVAQ